VRFTAGAASCSLTDRPECEAEEDDEDEQEHEEETEKWRR
jgi:hypothetical protein